MRPSHATQAAARIRMSCLSKARVMEPAGPKKIDKYDVLGMIARGGMGVVYKAIDRSLDRLVAIKMVASVDAEHRDYLQRFFREAKFTANLRHPNIVTVYGMGEFQGTPYLVMEYLSGKSLDSLINANAMTLPQKLNCISQVCHGLHHAHSRQPSIIHRDIKPGNIVVIDDGTAKIIDFGIARGGQSRDTRTGFVMGSYPYMSPEQINSTDLDGRSDIFSTGVVLYQLLTRTLPFAGDTISETLQSVIHGSPPPLSRFLRNYPTKLSDVLARALAKNREGRYASAGDFAFDLMAIEQQLKRQLHTNKLAQAEAFIGNGQYEQAKQGLLQIVELDDHDPLADELLRKIQRATAKEQRKTRAHSLRGHAEEALQMNRLHDALGYLDQAIRLDAANAELRTFRERVARVVAHADKIDEILARAQRVHAEGDLDGAMRIVQEGLSFDPDSARFKSFQAILERGRTDRSARSANPPIAAASPLASNDISDAPTAPMRAENTEPELYPSQGTDVEAVSSQPATVPVGRVADETLPMRGPAGLPQSVLQAAEKELAIYIGALTKIVIKKAVARATDPQGFYQLLAESIASKRDRAAFLRALHSREARPDAGTGTLSSARPAEHSQALARDPALTPSAVEQAAQLFARYVGPLAGVLTRKASQRVDNLRSLYLLLAEHIGTKAERTRFLQEAGLPEKYGKPGATGR